MGSIRQAFMVLYDLVNRVNDRANRLDAGLGHPHYKSVTLITRHVDAMGIERAETEEVDPDPIVTNVSPRLVGLTYGKDFESSVTVSALDLEARLSRSYPESAFVRDDAKRVSVSVSGQEYRIIYVDDRDCCFWRLVLRRLADG